MFSNTAQLLIYSVILLCMIQFIKYLLGHTESETGEKQLCISEQRNNKYFVNTWGVVRGNNLRFGVFSCSSEIRTNKPAWNKGYTHTVCKDAFL